MPSPALHLVVPPSLAGERLDRILAALVEDRTRAQLQKLVRRGRVRVNGRRVLRSNVSVDGRVEIVVELESPPADSPDVPDVTVIHEDAELLVVDKPAGLLTHPADRSSTGSLAELLQERFGPLPVTKGEERPGIVHRLDRETSGLLVVARTERALVALEQAFRSREVEKTYLALVSGVPAKQRFVVDDPLGPVPGKSDRQMSRPPSGAKSARTDVELHEAFARHSVLACRPLSGRRHQIRVHLAEHGHPVLADPLYGTRRRETLPAGVPAPGRLALHAWKLVLPHPARGERVAFASELPADLAATVEALRQA